MRRYEWPPRADESDDAGNCYGPKREYPEPLGLGWPLIFGRPQLLAIRYAPIIELAPKFGRFPFETYPGES